jgi:hypothetical protein
MRIFGPLLLPLFVAFTAGCRADRPEMAQVSGLVLIDGEPLRHGTIQFIPKGSRASYGRLDENGRFQLTCRDPNDGAVLGRHTVTVSGDEIIESTNFITKTRWHAPKKYADPHKSGLSADISESVNHLKFELAWNGGQPFVESERQFPEPVEAGSRARN